MDSFGRTLRWDLGAVAMTFLSVGSCLVQRLVDCEWVRLVSALTEVSALVAVWGRKRAVDGKRSGLPVSRDEALLLSSFFALIACVPHSALFARLAHCALLGAHYWKNRQPWSIVLFLFALCGELYRCHQLFGTLQLGAMVVGVTWKASQCWEREAGELRVREIALEKRLRSAEKELSDMKKQLLEQSNHMNDVHLSFLTNLSHELRTSMNGVSGMIGLLSESTLEPEAQEYVSTLEKSVESLMNLINDSLNFSRIDSQEQAVVEEVPFELEALLEEALDLLCSHVGEKQIDVSYVIDESVPSLIGDPSHIRSILCNLLSNAVKFTHRGDVFVTAKASNIGAYGEDIMLELVVSDTGIGIPKDQIPQIFQPFSTISAKTIPQYGGSGLGLAMCEKLTRLMGGKITVDSKEGVGSTFRITLPLKVDKTKRKSKDLPLSGVSIFIIDDSEKVLQSLKKMLTGWGCEVETASSWVDGIKGLKKAAIVSGQPHDLLLLDFSMPGLNGCDVAKLIRKDKSGLSSLSIAMLGSLTQKRLVTRLVQGYISKPVKKNHLWDVVSALCDKMEKANKRQRLRNSDQSTKLNVLVAEDNIMNQRIVRSMVEKLGHHCTVTSNGLEAVEEFTKGGYDVIFMDCRMPIMDGFEATKKIREKECSNPVRTDSNCNKYMTGHVPIIALTADVMHGTREACLKVGMDDYLSKPVKKLAIEEILQALVDKKSNSSHEPLPDSSDEFDTSVKPPILLVDDNEVNIKIGSVILRKHGFDVHVARGGQAAIDLIQTHPCLFQVVLMDMHMPGVDGQTATAQIRGFEEENGLPPVPIIALTGDTTEGFRGLCLAIGCSEYMAKPVDYPLLVQLCKKFVSDRRQK